MSIPEKVLLGIKKATRWTATILFLWMISIAFIQLLYRWLEISGLGWADQQLRMLVLWMALIGGTLAASEGRHIQINILDNFLPVKMRFKIRRVIDGLSGILTIFLVFTSTQFLLSERAAGAVIDGFFFGVTIPYWWSESLIPLFFLMMSFFFLGRCFLPHHLHESAN